eukprot:TRINITY_DN4375_c0_g1_i1.p1 TRINITY_DN4375_c0_g1~~TRINITY_DN4375_c0_g1_i1.p1  ORF type:complete len:349 (+),score=70.49 TRINITY_DN4375_c0_g1_i1:150-1196(+)
MNPADFFSLRLCFRELFNEDNNPDLDREIEEESKPRRERRKKQRKRDACYAILRLVSKDWKRAADSEYSFEQTRALVKAAQWGLLDSVKALVALTQPMKSDRDALLYAADNSHVEVVRFLLESNRGSPAEYSCACFRNACARGDIEMARLLLNEPRVDPTALGNAALKSAMFLKDKSTFRMLLEDKRCGSSKIFWDAVSLKDDELVKMLLKEEKVNPAVEIEGCNCLCLLWASYLGTKTLKLLLKDGRVDFINCRYHHPFRRPEGLNPSNLKVILKYSKADPSYDHCSALKAAFVLPHKVNVKVIELLMKDRRVADNIPKDLIHLRTQLDDRKLIRILDKIWNDRKNP